MHHNIIIGSRFAIKTVPDACRFLSFSMYQCYIMLCSLFKFKRISQIDLRSMYCNPYDIYFDTLNSLFVFVIY